MSTAQKLLTAIVALCLMAACGETGPGPLATPLEASVVVMGERVAEDNQTVEQFPECMAVAVSPVLVLTSDHCPAALVDGAHVLVPSKLWETTTQGNVLADEAAVRGEVRVLVPRVPLSAWVLSANRVNGPSVGIVLRGTELIEFQTTIVEDTIQQTVDHGDSGAPVFQQGRLVAMVQACNSSDDKACDLPGARVSGVYPGVL